MAEVSSNVFVAFAALNWSTRKLVFVRVDAKQFNQTAAIDYKD